MLKKILKFGDSSNKFRYQLEEETDNTIKETVKEEKAKIEEKKVEKVENTAKETKPVTSKKEQKKTSVKDSKKTPKIDNKQTEQQKQSVKTNSATTSDEPFWVKEMYKTKEEKQKESVTEATFATSNLISKPMPKRRPGASLDKYKKMAQQSKIKF